MAVGTGAFDVDNTLVDNNNATCEHNETVRGGVASLEYHNGGRSCRRTLSAPGAQRTPNRTGGACQDVQEQVSGPLRQRRGPASGL
jgi:hypothetical protein